MDIYQAISEAEPEAENYVITVVDGDHAGSKVLITDGSIVAAKGDTGWFYDNERELAAISESGILNLKGSKIYSELLGAERTLVICGAGHVSMPVITIGKMIGMRVVVIDDREKFAENAREKGADEVICDDFVKALETIESDKNTYFVIATRGHMCDVECLRSIAQKTHAYIGLLGSKRRTIMLKKRLADEGISKEVLDNVYTPIGMDIGAESPAEIGVAIMAEIIEVKNRSRNYGYSKDLINALTEEGRDNMILATIIARHGSSPRDMGTKMLVRNTGEIVGTIGGGCAEGTVIAVGVDMLHDGEEGPVIMHVDMSKDEGDGRDMICGGKIDVLLEIA